MRATCTDCNTTFDSIAECAGHRWLEHDAELPGPMLTRALSALVEPTRTALASETR